MTHAYLSCVTLSLKMRDSPSNKSVACGWHGCLHGASGPRIHASDTRFAYPPTMTGANAAWLALFLAGALEIAWAYGLKHADGFTRFWPSVGTVAAIGLSFAFMTVALRTIPFGTAYAIWCGIGVAGTAVVGIVAFGEATTATRLLCVALIATGIVGLKLAGTG